MTHTLSHHQLDLIGNIAKVLHGNGQQTGETLRTVQRLARHFGGELTVAPGWGHLLLAPARSTGLAADSRPLLLRLLDVTPNNVGMHRVAAANALAEQVIGGHLSIAQAQQQIGAIAVAPPLADALFALASAAGAAALAVTFGVAHLAAVLLIFISAGLGALARRRLGRLGASGFAQGFAAALLAGLIGAASVRWHLSSDLRLIAVCPCMVLVPGPFLLNGALDLLANRLPLGISRLLFAAIMLAAISAGLLLGAVLTPVSRRLHLPFAGIGFASVVSLMPGVLVFRMAGGLLAALTAVPAQVPAQVPRLLQAAMTDGGTALLVVAAMTIGIVIPQHACATWGGGAPAGH